MPNVQHPTWVFARDNQRITITRIGDGDARATLVVALEADSPRAYAFDDVFALARFQNDMEQFLVATGWSLVEFSPERRVGRDRRNFPRLTERRRWWSDAIGRLTDRKPPPRRRTSLDE